MPDPDPKSGADELAALRNQGNRLLLMVAVFSVVTNVLVLVGPLYMLLVYDRVLNSGSFETLVALSLITLFLYVVMGLLDFARGRILVRIAARFRKGAAKRVYYALLHNAATAPSHALAAGLRDLEVLGRAVGSPSMVAVFDLPWVPLFFLALLAFHPALALFALAGGVILVVIAVANQMLTRRTARLAQSALTQSDMLAAQVSSNAEVVTSLGMQSSTFRRWQELQDLHLSKSLAASDTGGIALAATKTIRLLLQSGILGLGAYLVLQNALGAGAMIAGSILMGRALSPIEAAIAQWPLLQSARASWINLTDLLTKTPPDLGHTHLPVPKANLVIDHLCVAPPSDTVATLRQVSLTLKPGQAVGIIGPSGAGKTTLARALTGYWHPSGGTIRLDGATLSQYDRADLGRYIGYLPQSTRLFDGTVAENIARLARDPDPDLVIHAAQLAGAHDLILSLPNGYDTIISATDNRLSGGQVRRIGLARAMYGSPVILVLDEPISNLDTAGIAAFNAAIRAQKAQGCAVLIMAHRPSAIHECETILVLENGMRTAYGPKDTVLRAMVKNHQEINIGNRSGHAR